MKRINCFIPYGKIEATRQTVAQLAESSLVSQHEDPPGNSRLCQCPLYVNLYED